MYIYGHFLRYFHENLPKLIKQPVQSTYHIFIKFRDDLGTLGTYYLLVHFYDPRVVIEKKIHCETNGSS